MTARRYRVIHASVAFMFFGFAAVQWNDPDPLRWITLYGAAGSASLLAATGRSPRWLALATGAVALVWALTLVPEALQLRQLEDFTKRMDIMRPEIEIAREVGGLTIVTLAMAAVFVLAQRSPVRTASSRGLGRASS